MKITDRAKVNVREFEDDIKKNFREGEQFMKDVRDIDEGFELEGQPEPENEFKKVEPWLYFKLTRTGQTLSGTVDHIAPADEFNKSPMLFLRDVNGVPGQNLKMFMHKDLEFKMKNINAPEGKKVWIKLARKDVTNEGREMNFYEVRVKD